MVDVAYRSRRDGTFTINGSVATVYAASDTHLDVAIGRRRINAPVTRVGDVIYVQLPTGTVELTVLPRFVLPGATIAAGGFVAPMPGLVLDIRVKPGDVVTAGQTLVVLEAMKMEHHMNAPAAGTVTGLSVAIGQQIENGVVLLTVEPDAPNEEDRS